MNDFAKKCYHYLKQNVPVGKVISYGDLARAIGHKGAARAVGSAMKNNPYAPQVPCHRVIKSNGDVGNYLYGAEQKILLLLQEGVKISKRKINKQHILTIK